MANTSLLAADAALRAEHAHFSAVPWLAPHLRARGWTVLPTRCRTVKPDGEDSLLAETLQTPATIPRVLTLAECDGVPVAAAAPAPAPAPPPPAAKDAALPPLALAIPAVKTLYALGPALDGFARVLHGGLVATLLDETMGVLLTTNEQHVVRAFAPAPSSSDADARREENRRGAAESGGTIDCVTASLQVRFRAPVRTPAAAVMVEARVVRAEGRRLYLRAELSGETGLCAIGEAVFVRVPTERL
jgi:acyl-coenzyme A thioesterase PaaI-like protein